MWKCKKKEVRIYPHSVDGPVFKLNGKEFPRPKHPNHYCILCKQGDTLEFTPKSISDAQMIAWGFAKDYARPEVKKEDKGG